MKSILDFCKVVGFVMTFGIMQAPSAQAETSPKAINLPAVLNALKENPDNRQARWALSGWLFQSEKYDAAKFHIRTLLRSTKTENDRRVLLKALKAVEEKSPWAFNADFAVLPSSNVYRYTYNDRFETVFGTFLPTGGGTAVSGIGLSLGGTLSYAFVTDDGSRIGLSAQLQQSLYEDHDLQSTRLRFGVKREQFYIGSESAVEAYSYLRFDGDTELYRRDFGLKYTHKWHLGDGKQVTVGLDMQDRTDLSNADLGGQFAKGDLSYTFPVTDKINAALGYSFSGFKAGLDHNSYVQHQVSAQINRSFKGIGNAGVFAAYSVSSYDGIYPATTMARKDRKVTLGGSFRPERFQIKGARPRMTCSQVFHQSNIALFDYRAMDCSLVFEKSF
ncbi:surface lipoprotein assembly modifier [Pacificibacter marinus]|uniref:surface lipoprotein assembly modifier n=1 Tax=Pacificibacter marinus TaxID=658057 RepID=UPI001C069FFF|nr:surface lipoprotein assembly modifier [Pacificibacter marinus]MBU2865469.1 DUF560 domain-containing protein [Pacificibacter marinus]